MRSPKATFHTFFVGFEVAAKVLLSLLFSIFDFDLIVIHFLIYQPNCRHVTTTPQLVLFGRNVGAGALRLPFPSFEDWGYPGIQELFGLT
jgi:hypothetical protein